MPASSMGTGGWNPWVTRHGYGVGAGQQIRHWTHTCGTHAAKPVGLPNLWTTLLLLRTACTRGHETSTLCARFVALRARTVSHTRSLAWAPYPSLCPYAHVPNLPRVQPSSHPWCHEMSTQGACSISWHMCWEQGSRRWWDCSGSGGVCTVLILLRCIWSREFSTSCIFCISEFTFFGHSQTVHSLNLSDSRQESIISYHM